MTMIFTDIINFEKKNFNILLSFKQFFRNASQIWLIKMSLPNFIVNVRCLPNMQHFQLDFFYILQ